MTHPHAQPEVPPRGDAVAGVLGRLVRLRAAVASVGERKLLAVAVVLFVVASAVAASNLPPVETVHWPVLLLLPLVGVPATVATNAWEYAVTARLLRHRVPPAEAARVSILSTAANLLPIPGAVLVRTRALRQRGSRLTPALSVTTLIGLAWVGVAGVLAGGLHLVVGERPFGAAVLALGVLVCAGTGVAVTRQAAVSASPADLATVVAVEVVAVLVAAARLLLALWGLGYDASVTQALALSLAAVLGSAVGFLPAGLGVRELLAAGIGPLVGLPAAVSLVATAVDRLLGLVVLAGVAAVLVATGGHRSERPG
jgi:uncharacterized membrane protein YbhN (UPF0104 family)